MPYPFTDDYATSIHPVGSRGPKASKHRRHMIEIGENVLDLNTRTSHLEAAFPILDAADGSDITDALQALIDSVSDTTIILKPYDYTLGKEAAGANAITMKPGVRIHQAKGGTITPTNINQKLFYYQAASTVENLKLSGMKFSNGSYTGINYIHFDGVDGAKRISGVQLEDIELVGNDDAGEIGMYLSYCVNMSINKIRPTNIFNAIWGNMCADTMIYDVRPQLGQGYGVYWYGDGSALTHEDEAVIIEKVVTNGQRYGVGVVGQDYGEMSDCSFTSCPAGNCLIMDNATNWAIGACQFDPAIQSPYAVAVSLNNTCEDVQLDNCKFFSGSYGIQMIGSTRCGVSNSQFKGNELADILLSGTTHCQVGWNRCWSALPLNNIAESGTKNMVSHNMYSVAISVSGTGSQNEDNMLI